MRVCLLFWISVCQRLVLNNIDSVKDKSIVMTRVRNETSEQWQNVTETVVVIDVDSESRYNASVSSWTRLGDGGVLIYISFTTTDTGNTHIHIRYIHTSAKCP